LYSETSYCTSGTVDHTGGILCKRKISLTCCTSMYTSTSWRRFYRHRRNKYVYMQCLQFLKHNCCFESCDVCPRLCAHKEYSIDHPHYTTSKLSEPRLTLAQAYDSRLIRSRLRGHGTTSASDYLYLVTICTLSQIVKSHMIQAFVWLHARSPVLVRDALFSELLCTRVCLCPGVSFLDH
jgi:hypothetical protein